MFLLVFIHIGSRRIWVSRGSTNLHGQWVVQQARNTCMEMPEQSESPRFLILDLDTKFTRQIKEIFKSGGINVLKLPLQSPNLNARCERVIGTIKGECLMVFFEEHLNHIVREFVDHYHHVWPRQGIGNRPPDGEQPPEGREAQPPVRTGTHGYSHARH